ncbi:hypothetical protein A5787_14260 [Mycobacterium sp. 852002-50816_SCH5313054-b]|nr:hypothetical protein A5787_14260 [Mycobacterium sp. 852002-50816_SCH5313054-b]
MGAHTVKLCVTCLEEPAEPGGLRCTDCATARPNAQPTSAPVSNAPVRAPDVLTASWQSDNDVYDDDLL